MLEPVFRPAFRPLNPRGRTALGFTLIEVMVVVAIVGILAAIALPSYSDYIRRSKIIEATRGLSDFRTRMEQYFLDNRKYSGGCALILAPVQANVKTFTFSCPAEDDTTYTLKAVGNAAEGMASFEYTVDQANFRKTIKTYWSGTAVDNCWVTKKDGTCA